MTRKVLLPMVLITMAAVGSLAAEEVQWVRVTVLLEQGNSDVQTNTESLIPGGVYSLVEVERKGQEAIDREILDRVQVLASEIRDVEQSMRLGGLLLRQYYLPLKVGQQAVVPAIDLNPRLGIVFEPERFVDGRVVCKIKFLEPEGPVGPTEFNGDPITLRLQDADLRKVLETFQMIAPYSIEVDPLVTGKVTVDLRNVPWDQALDVVLRTNNLGWKNEGGTLYVAPLDVLSQKKRVRTEATINLPRSAGGVATIASRGDEATRTVVLVVESVAGEPELVAERDGLVHPPLIAALSSTGATPNLLVFRGTVSKDGGLGDVRVLASPNDSLSEGFLEAVRSSPPWSVLDRNVRRIDAVVGYGLLVNHPPAVDAVATKPVEHVDVEVHVGPPPEEYQGRFPGDYVITAFVRDLDTGEVISAPRITASKGNEAKVRSRFTDSNGEQTFIEISVLVAKDGCKLNYSWKVTSNGRVLSSHSAEFEL